MEYHHQSINFKAFNANDEQIYEIDCPSLAMFSMVILFFNPSTEYYIILTWPNGKQYRSPVSSKASFDIKDIVLQRTDN